MHREREREKDFEREFGRSLNPVPSRLGRRIGWWGWKRTVVVLLGLVAVYYFFFMEHDDTDHTHPPGKAKPGRHKTVPNVGDEEGKTHITVDVGWGEAGITREYDVGSAVVSFGACWRFDLISLASFSKNIVIHLPAPPAPYSVPPVTMSLPPVSTPVTESMLQLTEQDKKDASEPLDPEDIKALTRKLRRFFELYSVAESLRGHMANPTQDPDMPNTLFTSPLLDPFLRHTRVMEQLLFPWLKPYHPSIRALVESFAYGGRGVVMCVGNGHVKQAVFLIRSLREVLKMTMGIEVWYIGDRDLGEKERGVVGAVDFVVSSL